MSPELPELEKNKQTSLWIAAFLVALIIFIIYLPALQNGFVNLDDNVYVYENPNIQSMDYGFLKWALSSRILELWHPLSFLSFALDYSVWGLNPKGYHLTNILFHSLNTLLVCLLTIKLFTAGGNKLDRREIACAFIASLLFGIHPLRVESVAWISERKDVLSTFFFLLSILSYLKYISSSHKRFNYLTCLLLFVLALMSKPMAVSLPVVLLILDYYPLNRLTKAGGAIKSVFIEKLPFFLLSLISSVIALWPAHPGGALSNLEIPSLTVRAFVAMRSYIFYIVKMALPLNLAPFYPYPSKIVPYSLEYLIPIFLLIGITSICLLLRNKACLTIWAYYLITLLPVSGILRIGNVAVADRYAYLPSVGLFILVGLGIAALLGKNSARRIRLAIIAILFLISSILGIKTMRQISIWKDSITLWSYEIRLFPDSQYIAYNNRGTAYSGKGQFDKAIKDFNKAIALTPDYAEAYNNRGVAYYNKGQYDRAIQDHDKAIALKPDYPDTYNNRGLVYNSEGQYDRAIQDFNKGIALNPYHAETYNSRGVAYYNKGQYDRAIQDHNQAIILKPDYVDAYNNRGTDYAGKGQYNMAIQDFNKTISLNPDFAMAYNNRGFTYYNKGQYGRAISDMQKACNMGYEKGCNNYKKYSQLLQ